MRYEIAALLSLTDEPDPIRVVDTKEQLEFILKMYREKFPRERFVYREIK